MITGGPERHRPDLHLVSPLSRRIRLPHIMFGLSAAALVGVGIYQFRERPQVTDDRPPIAGPAISGAAIEQERQLIPPEIRALMGKLEYWRSELPSDTNVSVSFYPEGAIGYVAVDEGLNFRRHPTKQSARQGAMQPGTGTTSRFLISINFADGHTENWLTFEYPWSGRLGETRNLFIDFAAQSIDSETFIEIFPTSPERTSIQVPWPRPQ